MTGARQDAWPKATELGWWWDDPSLLLWFWDWNTEKAGLVRRWRRQWQPTPVLLPGKSQARAWWAAVHGVVRSRTRLSDFTFTFHFSCIGEGNGNPLQCSCLENPRDRGAWWAAVYGVAQSQTRLKWLSSSNSSSQKMESWAEKSPKLGQGYVKDEWTEAASWIKGGRKRGMFQNIFISSFSRNPAVLSALGSWRFSCILSVASSLWASPELWLFQ